ncbi:MAG: hypothetical protein IJ572_01050 [Bacilli bacterium]|nr:hypothetical protein [Bacilli bacterium]
MNTKLQELKWKLYKYKYKHLLVWGLKNGFIKLYDDNLIDKLRNIYYGGIPASILLLSDGMSNGYCYDRALLMSKAFLDDEDDVQLVYATIDSLKLNPQFAGKDDPLFADHCIVERITKDGEHLIYDTSSGFVYDKRLYWLMEHPKIRKINKKSSIIEFVKSDEYYHPEDIKRDKYATPLILPMIEMTYGRPTEMYSHIGIELLQREVEHFKKVINYDDVYKEIDDDMKRLGLKR